MAANTMDGGIEMKKYVIGIHGFDDSTFVEMELDKQELQVIQKLADKSVENSQYGRMPTMEIKEVEE